MVPGTHTKQRMNYKKPVLGMKELDPYWKTAVLRMKVVGYRC